MAAVGQSEAGRPQDCYRAAEIADLVSPSVRRPSVNELANWIGAMAKASSWPAPRLSPTFEALSLSLSLSRRPVCVLCAGACLVIVDLAHDWQHPSAYIIISCCHSRPTICRHQSDVGIEADRSRWQAALSGNAGGGRLADRPATLTVGQLVGRQANNRLQRVRVVCESLMVCQATAQVFIISHRRRLF